MADEAGETKTVRVHLRIDSEGDATACTDWDMYEGTDLNDSIDGSVYPYRDYVIDVRVPVPTGERPADATVEIVDQPQASEITAAQVA